MSYYQLVESPWLKKAAPVVLTVAAGAGVVGTAVLAAKATPKAMERKAEAEKAKGEPLTTWETFKTMAPCYIPAAGTGLATIGAIYGLMVDSRKKQAELSAIIASGNQIINQASRKYEMLRDKVQEKDPEVLKEFDERSYSEQWNEYVRKNQKRRIGWCGMSAFPDVEGEEWGVVRRFGIEYGNGLEDENGCEIIYFEATPGDIVTAFYNLNAEYHHDGLKYVNDLFHFLNLPKTEMGNRLVWDPSVLWDEWETDWIGFHTEDWAMEDNVPQPAMVTIIKYDIPPLAEGYPDNMDIPALPGPSE